jgi:hypothetical protein
VVRDVLEKKPIGMSFIVGSTTTYTGKPPSFNYIYLDPDTLLPIDYETYAFDLEHANSHNEPVWDRVYNYRQTYNLQDLSPNSFQEYARTLYLNETASKEYRSHMWIGGPGG